ncbi:rRNA maturation RNase YbeY [Ekhidna sp.]|uniref:rRNA maturation RNase YbeY n=1 Tax=Ekhidna sp. TaxID=2608089 RepID=UPI003B505255
MNIHYFSEGIEFSLENTDEKSKWISSVIADHHYDLEELNYIFCSDEYLLSINKQHLDHDYYTDIITFDNSEEDRKIESDIFISIDRVRDNAENEGHPFDKELCRVMIHGVLHLLGFDDKSPEEKELMREKEDACLSLLKL